MDHSWLPIPDLPPNFDYPDLWMPAEPHTATPAFAGPQKNLDTTPLDIPPETIRAVQAGATHLFFWGWTRYRDVFKGTPEHISEYCVELKGFRGDPFDTNPSHPVLLTLENCKTHNCYDDECKAR
jgi:hypothetical protein